MTPNNKPSKTTPCVSVIVPAYNVGGLLRQCLDSLSSQTIENIEIIVIDDGSLDNTGEVLDYCAERDARIKALHVPNGGVSVARNIGIDTSTAQWIVFVDGDDWLERDAIEKLYSLVNGTNIDIYAAGYYANSEKSEVPHTFLAKQTVTEGIIQLGSDQKTLLEISCLINTKISPKKAPTNIGVCWGKIYRRQFLEDNQIRFVPGLKRMQDTIFSLECFEKANRFEILDEPLWHYRLWKGGVTKHGDNSFDKTGLEVLKYIWIFGHFYDKGEAFWSAYEIKSAQIFEETVEKKLLLSNPRKTMRSLSGGLKNLSEMEPYRHFISNGAWVQSSTKKKRPFFVSLQKKCYTMAMAYYKCYYKLAAFKRVHHDHAI